MYFGEIISVFNTSKYTRLHYATVTLWLNFG